MPGLHTAGISEIWVQYIIKFAFFPSYNFGSISHPRNIKCVPQTRFVNSLFPPFSVFSPFFFLCSPELSFPPNKNKKESHWIIRINTHSHTQKYATSNYLFFTTLLPFFHQRYSLESRCSLHVASRCHFINSFSFQSLHIILLECKFETRKCQKLC